MNKLNELEKLAKSSYSQSTVHVEIGELLDLIEIAKAARDVMDLGHRVGCKGWDEYLKLGNALIELECGE
jgi:hypothetical protein